MVELAMGYPIKFWMLVSIIPAYLSGYGTKILKLGSLLQAVINVVIFYVLFSIGLVGINGTGILIVNGVDVSGLLGWILIGFSIYMFPILIYSMFACLGQVFFVRDSPSFKVPVSISEEEFYNQLGYDHKGFFHLLNREQKETIERNLFKSCSYISNKRGEGGIIKFYYHDN